MPTWIIYGISAALALGAWIVAGKVAITKGIHPFLLAWCVIIGMIIVFGISYFLGAKFPLPENKMAPIFGILAGILLGLGIALQLKALAVGADVARLAPLYNTNTLVAVLLGIILLHELPQGGDIVRVVLGAVLIVIGATLVAFK